MKRKVRLLIALVLALALLPLSALAADAPDLTVRATGRKLYVNGVPLYGVVDVGGAFCIPGEVLADRNAIQDGTVSFYEGADAYDLSIRASRFQGRLPILSYWSAPPAGRVMGTAAPAQYTLVPEGDVDVAGGPVPSLRRATGRETVTAIHDYLVNTLTYDPLTSAPYGTTQAALDAAEAAQAQAADKYAFANNVTLASKYGVCQNHAELFRTMCIRSGIPCILVSGTGNGGPHAWNMAYVDGQWLYVDCTFDDPVSKTPTLLHTYCLTGPDTMARSHYRDGDDYPMPREYDPAWAQLDPNNITSADMFRKWVAAQLMQHKTSFSLRTVRSGAYGGIARASAFPESGWYYISGGYNSAKGTYDFTVEYW